MATVMTAEVRGCLAEMGITEEVIDKMRAAQSQEDGDKLLRAAKEICHKGWRTVARDYHPDHNQQLPKEEIARREERFKRLTSVHDSFMDSKFRLVHPASHLSQRVNRDLDELLRRVAEINVRNDRIDIELNRHAARVNALNDVIRKRHEDREKMIAMAREIMNRKTQK